MDERIKTIEGDFNARGLRFGIVASRFNGFIVDRLLAAAVDTLVKHGVDPGDIEVNKETICWSIALKNLKNSVIDNAGGPQECPNDR